MRVFFVIYLILLFFLRILLSFKLELHPDEAYYWLWSKNLALSYFDHPPMVAYLISLFTVFSDKEIFIRFTSLFTFIISLYILWILVKRLFKSNEIALSSIFMLNCLPLTASGFIVTADTALMFFFVLSVYFFYLSLESNKVIHWVVAGFFMGCALLSKYNGILISVSLFVFLLISDKKRRLILSFHPYIATVVMLITFLPVVLWNYNNNWISFKYQFLHGLPNTSGNIFNIFTFILGQISAMGVFLGFFAITLPVVYFFDKKDELKFVSVFALVPLVFFSITSYKSVAEMNWAASAYPAISILLGYFFTWSKIKKLKFCFIISFLFSIALIIILYLHAAFRVLPLEKFNKMWAVTDPTNWFYGWKEFAQYLDKKYIDLPIYTTNHQLAAELSYYKKSDYKIFFNERQYRIWEKEDIPEKCYFIYYESDVSTTPPDRNVFKKIDWIEDYEAKRNGIVIRKYHIYLCQR